MIRIDFTLKDGMRGQWRCDFAVVDESNLYVYGDDKTGDFIIPLSQCDHYLFRGEERS